MGKSFDLDKKILYNELDKLWQAIGLVTKALYLIGGALGIMFPPLTREQAELEDIMHRRERTRDSEEKEECQETNTES